MAITYTLRFTPDISAAELQRLSRRLGEWTACQSESASGLRGAVHHEMRNLSLTSEDEKQTVSEESTSVGPGLFGPDGTIDIVLHPALFFDLPDAERSLLELIQGFPLVTWERRDEG